MRQKIKSIMIGVLKLSFAGGIIAWMIYKEVLDLSVFKLIFSPAYLSLCLGLTFLNLSLGTLRWQSLLRGQGIEVSFWKCFSLTLIGIFFNFAIPGGVGGDVVKVYYAVQDHPERRLSAGMSVLIDRIIGLYAMLILAIMVMLFEPSRLGDTPQLKLIFTGLVSFFFIFSAALAFAFSTRVNESGVALYLKKIPLGEKIYKIYQAIHSYGRSGRVIMLGVLYSLGAQISMVFIGYVVGQAMGLSDVSLWAYFFVLPIGFMVTAIPISPGGIGLGQAAFYFLFNLYLGYKSQLGPNAITVIQVMQFCFGLVGAYFYVRRKKESRVPLVS